LWADRGMIRCVLNAGKERFSWTLTEHGHDFFFFVCWQGARAP
jgi:hypothetical protein